MAGDFDILGEIKEIGRMISAAGTLMAVRREVAKVMKEGFVVTDGRHHIAGKDYDVIVTCSEQESVARRLRSSLPDAKIEKIATGVLGIRTARRIKKLE
jgi:uncharacterized protein YjbK